MGRIVIRSSGFKRPQSELAAALATYKASFAGVAVFTALLNILYLTGSFFMLQVYDRVLPSRSVPTLVGLCALALALYAFQAVLDIVRGRVLARIAGGFAEQLERRTYRLIVTLPLKAPALRRFEPARDLEQIRNFMAGGGPEYEALDSLSRASIWSHGEGDFETRLPPGHVAGARSVFDCP